MKIVVASDEKTYLTDKVIEYLNEVLKLDQDLV